MRFRVTDSESSCHRENAGQFRINVPEPAKLHEMTTKHEPADPVMTGFVQMRLRQERAKPTSDGRPVQLKELAHKAGVAKSHPSQILSGALGVGTRAAAKYAKLFGYASIEDFRRDAMVWWQQEGLKGAELAASPPTTAIAAAIEYVTTSTNQGSRSQVEVILARYAHPDFRERDYEWWVTTLLTELRRDHVAIRRQVEDAKVEALGKSKAKRRTKKHHERHQEEASRLEAAQKARTSSAIVANRPRKATA